MNDPPGVSGVPRLALALCLLWTAILVAGLVLSRAAHRAGSLPGDLVVTRTLQRLPTESLFASGLSALGNAAWLLPLLGLYEPLLASSLISWR